jgi:Uma2 family endonuclease
MAVSYATYERVVLEDDAVWELVCGHLREKAMTQEHNSIARILMSQLVRQLDEDVYQVGMNAPALRVADETYFMPDVVVIPNDLQKALHGATGIEMYADAVPFVAEIWSPSTGSSDLETKVPAYQARGDLEIWRIHPRERTVTAWRRQTDGSYISEIHSAGEAAVKSLGVTIAVERLFR